MSLQKLLKKQSLDIDESYQLFDDILNNLYSEIEISSILTSLKIKNESISEITGAVNALIKNAKRVNIQHDSLTDLCGTGGDGFHTFNISTLSSIVSAAVGIPIIKHGNRSVSSKCGSADILEKTGYNISNTNVHSIFNKTGFAFVFAPLFHQGVKNVMNVRNALKTRTIFNILGPLINPAPIQNQIIGVYDSHLSEKLIHVLKHLGRKKAIVCHGSGLDEIAIHGKTEGYLLENNIISPFSIDPSGFIKEKFTIKDLEALTVDDNIEIFKNILIGKATSAQTSAVSINVASALFINDKVDSIKEGFLLAKSFIEKGKSHDFYIRVCEVSYDSK